MKLVAELSKFRPKNLIMLDIPWIWITVNPADTRDPIVPFLGVDINLDDFDPSLDAAAAWRQRNVVGNPFTAAESFDTVTYAIHGHLIGVKK